MINFVYLKELCHYIKVIVSSFTNINTTQLKILNISSNNEPELPVTDLSWKLNFSILVRHAFKLDIM